MPLLNVNLNNFSSSKIPLNYINPHRIDILDDTTLFPTPVKVDEAEQLDNIYSVLGQMCADEVDQETKDGEIGYTKQGGIGDCWLLAGITSLTYSEEGRQIIKDALEYRDGYTIVHLATGDIVVGDNEIAQAQADEYKYPSTGDTDMVIFELAFQKTLDKIASGEIAIVEDAPSWMSDVDTGLSRGSLNGGYALEAYYLLTGKIGQKSSSWCQNEEKTNELLDVFMNSNGEYALCANNPFEEQNIRDINGNTIQLYAPHAYSVKNVTEDTVTVVNPHDSSKDIVLSRKDFVKYFYGVELVDLSENNPEVDLTLDGQVEKINIYDEDGNNIEKKYIWPDGRMYQKIWNEDGSITERTTSSDGYITEETKLNGETISYIKTSAEGACTIFYEYDENGNFTVTQTTYDAEGNIIEESVGHREYD